MLVRKGMLIVMAIVVAMLGLAAPADAVDSAPPPTGSVMTCTIEWRREFSSSRAETSGDGTCTSSTGTQFVVWLSGAYFGAGNGGGCQVPWMQFRLYFDELRTSYALRWDRPVESNVDYLWTHQFNVEPETLGALPFVAGGPLSDPETGTGDPSGTATLTGTRWCPWNQITWRYDGTETGTMAMVFTLPQGHPY